MRAVVWGLLLSGLLAGLVQGLSIETIKFVTAPPPGQVIKLVRPIDIPEDSYSSQSQQNDGSFIVSQESEEEKVWTSPEDPDWMPSKESQEQDDSDRSFIASEETEEGKLWASDDDPDWIPSDSQEDYTQEDYTQEDYTQEDYSQEDHTREDYTQEDYTQEDYTQEDYTQEDYTQEDYSQEDHTGEHYSQEDYTQEDLSDEDSQSRDVDRPFPKIPIPEDPQVIAEYWGSNLQRLDDDWSQSQSQDDQDYSRKYIPLRTKRESQTQYQTSPQLVKVPPTYQDQQDRQDPGQWGAIYEGEGGQPGVSTGVEPLLPAGGPQQHEVSAGVEPEGTASDKDEGTGIGGWFERGWDKFTGVVGDIGDKVVDTASDIGDKVVDTASDVHDTLHDKFSGAVDKIHQTYHEVREGFLRIVDRFKILMRKFGIVVQEGIKYCLRRFDQVIDKAQDSVVIEKLEKALDEGHAEVAKFFQILGEKVQAWKQQHTSENIDAGLIGGHTHGGQQSQQEGQYNQDFEDMPDFFQDSQVQVQLNRLVDEGILTQDDIIILTEEHVIQDQQNQHQDQHGDQQHQHQQQNQQHQQSQQNYQQQGQYNPKFIQFPE